MKTIQIDRDLFNFLQAKASPAGEPIAQTLRRELGVPEPQESIEIDDETYGFLVSKATDLEESPSAILRRELHLETTPHAPHPAGGVVEFHIPAGVGSGPWNTRETAVLAAMGQTLRLVNDDAVSHRLHTDGTPFPHPVADLQPGQSADFLLQTAFAGSPLHDHSLGLAAEFWITVKTAP